MKLLTIILSWNRPKLLKKTIESYINATIYPYDLIVVDNGSDKETINTLKNLSQKYKFRIELLDKNYGGLAFNHVLKKINLNQYDYIHFSENDIEFLKNWDTILIKKLELFSEVGQISPFSPFPQSHKGEFSWKKLATISTKKNQSIYIAKNNVGTSSIVRRKIIQQGIKWTNINTKQGFKFPNDGQFSRNIKKLGWKVAFNDKYVVTNWGHNINEISNNLNYYIKNHKSKSFKKFQDKLLSFGYKLVKDKNGEYKLERIKNKK